MVCGRKKCKFFIIWSVSLLASELIMRKRMKYCNYRVFFLWAQWLKLVSIYVLPYQRTYFTKVSLLVLGIVSDIRHWYIAECRITLYSWHLLVHHWQGMEGQWYGALMFSLLLAWPNCCRNSRVAGYLWVSFVSILQKTVPVITDFLSQP